jgi:hypothetical protein
MQVAKLIILYVQQLAQITILPPEPSTVAEYPPFSHGPDPFSIPLPSHLMQINTDSR